MTRRDRVVRDAQINTLIDDGVPPSAAGARFGLGERQVRRIRAERRGIEARGFDARETIEDTLVGYSAAIEELSELSSDATVQGSVRVAAIRTRLEAMKGRIELLQALGLLPPELEQMTMEERLRTISRQLTRVLDAFNVSDELATAMLDVFEGREPTLPGAPVAS